jgi:hypothetical protein
MDMRHISPSDMTGAMSALFVSGLAKVVVPGTKGGPDEGSDPDRRGRCATRDGGEI